MADHKVTRKGLIDLDCQENLNDNCAIKLIRRIKDSYTSTENLSGVKTGSMKYLIVLAGPNPCCCNEEDVKAAAWAWEPPDPTGPMEDEIREAIECGGVEILPAPGDFLPLGSDLSGSGELAEYAVKSVTAGPTSKDCRHWEATVNFDNRCLVNDSFYQIDGTPIVHIDDLPLAAAKISVRYVDRDVPVESAEYHGIYGRDGEKRIYTVEPEPDPGAPPEAIRNYTDTTFPFDGNYCCRALRVMQEGQEYAPVNSAGVPFDPPLIKDSADFEYVITKPYRAVNMCQARQLRNKVNCDDFWLVEYRKGFITKCDKVIAGTARIKTFEYNDAEFCDGTPIIMVSTILAIRYNKRTLVERDGSGDVIDETDHYFGWDDLVANKGFGEHLCAGDKDNAGGTFGQLAADGEGSFVGKGTTQQIQDSYGNQPEDPVFLDHVGHSVNQTQIEADDIPCSSGLREDQLLYLRYRKYGKRMEFAANDGDDGTNMPDLVFTAIFPGTSLPPGDDASSICICRNPIDYTECPGDLGTPSVTEPE